MRDRYLEITFRKGRPLAAYFYLERRPGDRSVRSEALESCLVVDYAKDERAIGIEITDPQNVTIEAINALLERLGQAAADPRELEPLRAA